MQAGDHDVSCSINRLVCITIDHHVIRAWAARTGARPSTIEGDERAWPLFFDFGAPDAGIVQVSWNRFFQEFERANLALVCRDFGGSGELDDFHEFVNIAAVPDLIKAGRSTIVKCVF